MSSFFNLNFKIFQPPPVDKKTGLPIKDSTYVGDCTVRLKNRLMIFEIICSTHSETNFKNRILELNHKKPAQSVQDAVLVLY